MGPFSSGENSSLLAKSESLPSPLSFLLPDGTVTAYLTGLLHRTRSCFCTCFKWVQAHSKGTVNLAVFFSIFLVLGMEPRASYLLSKRSTAELNP